MKLRILFLASIFLLDKVVLSTDICSQPAKGGRCRGYFKRYFYNGESARCESFTYSGCGGNRNNFIFEEECIDVCVPKKTAAWHASNY